MSFVFDLSPQEKRQQLQSLTEGWSGENDFDVSPGAGVLKGAGMGIERGVVKTVGALANVATGLNAAFGTIDEDERDARFRSSDNFTDSAVDYWTPKTTEVGKVGQTLGSFGEMVAPLLVGRGNPSLLAMTQTMNTGTDLIKQGVDAKTATDVGLITGGATLLGAWLPVLGKTLTGKVVGNAAINTALGGGVAAAQSGTLESAGYDEQAQAFDPFDMQARTVDLLLGAAFGALTRGQTADLPAAVFGAEGAKRVQSGVDGALESLGMAMKPSDMDAAFSAANIKHFQIDSSPGKPLNEQSWAAHSNAMETSIDQLSKGEPINVANQMDGAEFRVKPQTDYQGSIDDVLVQVDDLDEPQNFKSAQASDDVVIDRAGANNFLAAKSPSGIVGGHVRDGALYIKTAEVLPEMRGKGDGIKLYQKLVDSAIDDGLKVYSDSAVEADAVRMYEALERRGYDVRRLDGGSLEDGAAFGKGAKEPAFEVVAKPVSKEIDTATPVVKTQEAAVAVQDAGQFDADAEVAAIQQHISQHGDFEVSISSGDDGDGRITRPASQLLDEADAAVQEANTMGKGILAAARCFMGFGQ